MPAWFSDSLMNRGFRVQEGDSNRASPGVRQVNPGSKDGAGSFWK